MNNRFLWTIALGGLLALTPAVRAGEEGVHASLTTDEDGDEAILMESEWISMSLLPWRQALINRFVFRPTGNDIVEPTNAKSRMSGGGGILMDCLWEQDWRFQELAYKQYKYQVTKNGPDEAQVVFETDITGWLGGDHSGVISSLLSDLTLRRTVSLRRGQPFFRFDFEFIDNDKYAKCPKFWVHNSSYVARGGRDTAVRPTDQCLSAIGGDQAAYAGPQGTQFIDFFNHGWTADISKDRREGIVYLMDYDYVEKLYNCFSPSDDSGTTEWWYDSILVFNKRPWKGRVYILPTIGLARVDYANRYFIAAVEPKRDEGRLSIDYALTASYESAAKVTLKTEIEYDLEKPAAQHQKLTLPTVEFDGLTIQPQRENAAIALAAGDPLLLNITALVELPDGQVQKFYFQRFYTGEYKWKGNRTITGDPLVKLERKVRDPIVPEVPPGLTINRNAFHVFGIHGFGTFRLGLDRAVEQNIPQAHYEIGYCTGIAASQNGLTDFPYDYERLYDCRALVFANIQDKEFRRIGASILMPYLKAGGGLVIVGGLYAFSYELEDHPINQYYPVAVKPNSLRRGPLPLQKPEAPDHPVFRGIDLAKLPYVYYPHEIALKPGTDARVLMKVGDQPFLIEKRTGNQITMVVAAGPFGAASDFAGKMSLQDWPEWPKLFANIVRYAAQDLK